MIQSISHGAFNKEFRFTNMFQFITNNTTLKQWLNASQGMHHHIDKLHLPCFIKKKKKKITKNKEQSISYHCWHVNDRKHSMQKDQKKKKKT